MRQSLKILAAVAVGALIALPAQANEKGDWRIRVGAGMVSPDNPVYSDSTDDLAFEVDDGTSLVISGTYFFSPNWAFDILGAFPFSHDIKIGTVSPGTPFVKIGETKHLPPTFSFQYHFLPDGMFQPYAGLGLNWTTFMDEELDQTLLPGATVSIDDSFGVAVQLGADWKLNDKWLLNFDLRYIQIEPDATLFDGVDTDTVGIDINPWVYALNVGYMF